MRHYLILLLTLLLGTFSTNADTWTSIGKGYYEDPIWVRGDNPISGDVNIEENTGTPGYYRFTSLFSNAGDQYIYVHCENPYKVYVRDYSNINSTGNTITVSQLCNENGWESYNYFVALKNNEITIPGNYFAFYSDKDLWNNGSNNRQFILRLPSNGDSRLTSGIYFGITAFNHLPKFMPIQLIDESNKQNYKDFVDSQTMDDYTYLYYSVDKAIEAMVNRTYPKNLSSVAIITFTDGNDDGSLEKAPNTSWTDIDYQRYVDDKIKNTYVQRHKLEAFSIGLKGKDIGDYNYDLFKSNLLALASDSDKATEVTNMYEVEHTLNDIIDKLQNSWLNTKVQVMINMRGTGDQIRFTLDKTRAEMNNDPENSEIWIEGVFSRDDLSLNDIVYHGFSSTSGTKVIAEPVTIDGKTKYQFTFENLRDANDKNLEIGEINFWHKNATTPAWQPHSEFGGGSDVKTETEYSSAAVMLVMDCSSSLGETDFAKLKEVVNSVVGRLADKTSGVETITTMDDADFGDAPIEYYNLQGLRIENPTNGIYIQRQGNKVKKVYIR